MKQPPASARIGSGTIVEEGTVVGLRYHPEAGPAVLGRHGIVRCGTIIYGDVSFGDYFQSGHYTVIRARVTGGDHCAIGNHSTLEGLVQLGTGVRLMSHVYVPSRTKLGDHVFVGPGCVFLNDRTPGRYGDTSAGPMPVPRGAVVEDDVMIGGGCTILPGVRIGRGSFIAAGTLVTKDVPPFSLVKGSPGRSEPLPDNLRQPNDRRLTMAKTDIWHPEAPRPEA